MVRTFVSEHVSSCVSFVQVEYSGDHLVRGVRGGRAADFGGCAVVLRAGRAAGVLLVSSRR